MTALRWIVALGGVMAVLGGPTHGQAEAPNAKGRMPRFGDPGATTEVTGRIVESTRGRPGPVRLVLSLPAGEDLAVLVGPDSLCDRLGLSLRVGEEVTVVGHRVEGDRPLLVAGTLFSRGRRFDVRGTPGRLD